MCPAAFFPPPLTLYVDLSLSGVFQGIRQFGIFLLFSLPIHTCLYYNTFIWELESTDFGQTGEFFLLYSRLENY